MAGTMIVPPPTPIIPERKPEEEGEVLGEFAPHQAEGGEVGPEEKEEAYGDEEPAEGPLEVSLGEAVGEAGAEAGGEDGGEGQEKRGLGVQGALQAVGQGPHEPREEDGHQARAVGPVLGKLEKPHHQGDHHRAAA